MTRYGISEEGAAAMELLGEKLRNAANGIGTQSSNLNSKVTALSGGGRLGIFGDEIKTLTTGNSMAVQRANENIGVISQKTRSIAGKIRELVSVGLGGTHVSEVNGSAEAASANISNSGNISAGFGNKMTSEAAINGSDNYSDSGSANLGGVHRKYVGSEFVNPFKNSNTGNDNFIKSENLDAYLKPEVGATPRSLEKTQLGFRKTEDGFYVYDSPEETNEYLIPQQGLAYPDKFRGTCGLCSCANVLRMSGKKVTEKEIIDYAANTKAKVSFSDFPLGWAATKLADPTIVGAPYENPDFNGAVHSTGMKQILEHFGIKSELKKITYTKDSKMVDYKTIENISDYVSDGKGVIISVDAGVFWDIPEHLGGEHALTVTSVTKDKNGNILGFDICDTGNGSGTQYYSANKIMESLNGSPMVVTTPIR